MLQNSRVTGFTVFELLRENQQGIKLPPPRLGLRDRLQISLRLLSEFNRIN